MFTRRKIFFPVNLNEARGSDSLSRVCVTRVRDSNVSPLCTSPCFALARFYLAFK